MGQYSFILPILFAIWILLIAIRVARYVDKNLVKNSVKEVEEKACPPHMWRWLDKPGEEGKQFILCLRCKKTPGQVTDGT
jgi:hypothetical protein